MSRTTVCIPPDALPPWEWCGHPDNQRLALSVARGYGDEDLVGFALEGIWRAMESFRPSCGVWVPYARQRARWRINHELDRRARERARERTAVAMDTGLDATLAYVVTEKLLTLTTERQAEAIRLRYGLEPHTHPHTWEEVGEAMGISKPAAYMLGNAGIKRLHEITRAQVSV